MALSCRQRESIVNTCGTCKFFGPLVEDGHWDEEKDDWVEGDRFHECQLVQHINSDNEARKAVAAAAAAAVKDGSGYFAVLCVSEEFGCNQWQPATPPEKS